MREHGTRTPSLPFEKASTKQAAGPLRGPLRLARVARTATLWYPSPMRLGRRSGLTPLDEAAAYARCHGHRDNDVRIVKLPPRRPRYEEVLATGEELRELFEQRLDAREADST